MLEDAGGIRRVILACGFVDLRKGIDGLAQVIGSQYNLNPFDQGTLFLFCGRKANRIKVLYWEGDGFVLLYKRLEDGRFQWPRSQEEVRRISDQEFRWLLEGLSIDQPKAVKKVSQKSIL